MKIIFDTKPYISSHLKNPRGRGTWAFEVSFCTAIIWSPVLSYSEAKKWATKKLKEMPEAQPFPVIILDVLP